MFSKRDVPELAWTAEQAAKSLGVTANWLAQLRVKGEGPPYVKFGRRVLYRREDLSAWLETKVQRSTSDNRRSQAAQNER